MTDIELPKAFGIREPVHLFIYSFFSFQGTPLGRFTTVPENQRRIVAGLSKRSGRARSVFRHYSGWTL
jgi:molybdopterin-biosynthesis enzyme MoeA-like protein